MLFIIPVSWTIFNIPDLKKLGLYLLRMTGIPLSGTTAGADMSKFFTLFGRYWWLLLICGICCSPYPMQLVKKYKDNIVCKLIILALFWISAVQLAKGADNPFLYFRF